MRRLLIFAVVLQLFFALNVYAATLDIRNGILFGAEDVVVNGVLYDVLFQDGTAIELFDGADANTDFPFTNSADLYNYDLVNMANEALIDQVLIGDFDFDSALINGIGSINGGYIWTPYAVNSGGGLGIRGIRIGNQEDDDILLNTSTNTSFDTGWWVDDDSLGPLYDHTVYAVWSIAAPVYAEIDFSRAKSLSSDENMIRFENVIINGEPYWMNYRVLQRGFLAPTEVGKLATFEIPRANISIDGDPSDWDGIAPVYRDPEGDQEPNNGHIGTDAKEIFIARDDDFLYCAYTLYDGDPQRDGTEYVTELQQYFEQYHTVGDTIIEASFGEDEFGEEGWHVYVSHRETLGHRLSFDSSYVGVGTYFIEYKVPIADIEYDGDGQFHTMGIEGRFIRSYIHRYIPSEDGQNKNTYDGVSEGNKVMIIDFY